MFPVEVAAGITRQQKRPESSHNVLLQSGMELIDS
jgi:hypothetical protein